MRRRLTVVLACLVLAAGVAACGNDGDGSGDEAGRAPSIFTLTADGGTFADNAKGTVALTLTGVAGSVVTFTDRATPRGAALATGPFLEGWRRTFGDDSPNATIVVTGAGPDQDTVLATLEPPQYDAASATARFTVRVITDVDDDSAVAFAERDADRSLPASFGTVTVFVDGADATAGAGAATRPAAFYVSFSGEADDDIDNVIGFTASGAPLPDPVLTGVPDSVTLDELRGMVLSANGTLFVADTNRSASAVLAFGPPDVRGRRAFLGNTPFTATSDTNPGLVHPYGLAFDTSGNLLASSQDTFVVTRYGADGAPTAVARALQSEFPATTFLPGTAVGGASAGANLPPPIPTSDGGLLSPRGIAVADGVLYVADATGQAVRAYDASTGAYRGDVLTKADNDGQPVGVLVAGNTLYVSSEGTDNVVTVDVATGAVTVVVPDEVGDVRLDHPSGLAIGPDGALYVNSREGRQVNRYDLDANTASVFVDDLDDEPEHLIALPT